MSQAGQDAPGRSRARARQPRLRAACRRLSSVRARAGSARAGSPPTSLRCAGAAAGPGRRCGSTTSPGPGTAACSPVSIPGPAGPCEFSPAGADAAPLSRVGPRLVRTRGAPARTPTACPCRRPWFWLQHDVEYAENEDNGAARQEQNPCPASSRGAVERRPCAGTPPEYGRSQGEDPGGDNDNLLDGFGGIGDRRPEKAGSNNTEASQAEPRDAIGRASLSSGWLGHGKTIRALSDMADLQRDLDSVAVSRRSSFWRRRRRPARGCALRLGSTSLGARRCFCR